MLVIAVNEDVHNSVSKVENSIIMQVIVYIVVYVMKTVQLGQLRK